MTASVEKKFAVDVVYNGVTKDVRVEPEEQVAALLQKAIAVFGITQQPHLLSLFRQDGTLVPENESVERAGLKPDELLLLRANVVKGGGKPLHLAADIVRTTFRTLSECGQGNCECVVYWTGPAVDEIVDHVEHPVHERSFCGYEIEDEWLTNFWKDLARSERSVKAQIHSHPKRAYHSPTDDMWPIVSQVGFLSIVVPDFATGEPSLDRAWVGCLQADGKWRRLALAAEAFVVS